MLITRDRLPRFIYITAICFAAVLVGSCLMFLGIMHRNALSRAEAATQDLAVVLEEHAERLFAVSNFVAEDVVRYIQQQGGLTAVAGTRMAHLYLEELSTQLTTSGSVWILDAKGHPVVMSNRFPAVENDFSDRKWFNAHAKGGQQQHIGEALIGRVSKEPLFVFSRSVIDGEGRFAGVVALRLHPTFFKTVTFSAEYGRLAFFSMFRDDGGIVASNRLTGENIERNFSDTSIFHEFADQQQGTYRTVSSVDGIERIVSFRRLSDLHLVVAAGVAVEEVLAGWTEAVRFTVAFLLLALSSIAGLAWFGFRTSRRENAARSQLEQALTQKEVLFKEIHHRIKNHLQMTSSLLRLQASRIDDASVRAAFDETEARLTSIALVHETLYRTDKVVDLELPAYVKRLVNELAVAYGAAERSIGVRLDLEPCMIDIHRAVSMALVITEVLTNAFKHAFPVGKSGEVSVAVSCSGEMYNIVVRDTGVGMAKKPGGGSLGLTLIHSLVQQMDGQYSFTNEGGTIFQLQVPLAAPHDQVH